MENQSHNAQRSMAPSLYSHKTPVTVKRGRVHFSRELSKTPVAEMDGDLMFEDAKDGLCFTPFSPSRQFQHLLRQGQKKPLAKLNLSRYKQALQKLNGESLASSNSSLATRTQPKSSTPKQISQQEQNFIHWINEELNTLEKYKIHVFESDEEREQASLKRVEKQKLRDLWEGIKDAFAEHIVAPLCPLYEKLIMDIKSKKYIVKKEVSFEYDVGLKDFLVKLFLENYEELWLILILESFLVNSPISLIHFGATSTQRVKISLKNFFGLIEKPSSTSYGATSFSFNTSAYSQTIFDNWKSQTTLGRQLDFNQQILAKVLFLVLVLDAAKECRVIPENPRLFCLKSVVKSSKGIIEEFAKRCLLSEGDLLKRLGYIGYNVVVKQAIQDELAAMCIRQLSTDLRDGFVLARLLETLTLDSHLVSSLKLVPASTPLTERMKTARQNMSFLFKYLEADKGMDMSFKGDVICSEDLVNGHKEKTMALLWKLVSSWKIPSLIDRSILLDEIDRLVEEIKEKELYWNIEILAHLPSEIQFIEDQHQMQGEGHQDHLSLLFEWIWCCVALQSDIYINDFSFDFVDGKVFCSLLSYYFPSLLNPDDIITDDASPDLISPSSDCMRLFISKMKDGLGGLPHLISEEDLLTNDDNYLDEKIIVTLCAHLSSIFLRRKDEIRSCKMIQRFWRRFQ